MCKKIKKKPLVRLLRIGAGYNEKFFEVKPEDIDLSPLTWEKVDAAKNLLYAVVRHYLIVLKDGYIPPQYLTLEC